MSRELDDLDYAVALADGWEPTTAPAHWKCNSQRPLKRDGDYMCWDCQGRRFSRDWDEGGPLIEKYGVAIRPMKLSEGWRPETWKADLRNVGQLCDPGDGPTPLIAAMRAIVNAAPSSTQQGDEK
jgi:hypothetical protein